MKRVAVGLVVCLLVVGCGGSDPATPSSPGRMVTTTGEALFNERVVGANPGCVTCHSLDEGITVVGPSLFSVTSKVDGQSLEEYLEQSIVDPDAFVVDGFSAGQMPGGWDDLLTQEQIQSLVEFLTR